MNWNGYTIPKTNDFARPTNHEEMHYLASYYAFTKSAKKKKALADLFSEMACEHGFIVVPGTPNCYEWDGTYIFLHHGMHTCGE